MIGTFGDVVFAVSGNQVKTFDEMRRNGQARLAEHVVIGQKPRLEFLGPGLETYSFKIMLSTYHGLAPDAELEALRKIRDTGEVRRLVIGEASRGKYMIESLDETEGPRSNKGAPTWITVDLTLKEYVEHG